jgi:hypothetical protein
MFKETFDELVSIEYMNRKGMLSTQHHILRDNGSKV